MLTKEQYADRCLIIVGCGGEADELLCQRRLKAGGRLAHFTCRGENDPRVTVDRAADLGKSFFWRPPVEDVVSTLGKKIGALQRRRYTKTGPDAVVLRDDQTAVLYDQGGDLTHLRVFSEGVCEVEMSGQVLLCPDLQLAEELDVSVHDECLKAFGTYSFRFLLPSMVINCSLQILRLMTIIYFESRALINPDNFWWRPAVTISNYLLQTSLILSHMFTVFVTGDDGASWMHIGLGILLSGTFALGAMYLEPRISPIYAAYCGAVGLFLSQPFLHYYETIKIYPSRRFLPSLMWAMCCLVATFGAAISNTVTGVVYGAMLKSGTMPVRASLFLPVATAGGEVFFILWMQHTYNWMVWSRREKDGGVVGDHLFLPAATVCMAAHALAESIRLGATFSAAAASGSYAWILSVLVTLVMNVCTRLGWTRFALFRTLKRLGGARIAMKVSGQSSWHELHENIKIFGGYGRFMAVLALITARAVMHGFSVSPAFNSSAGFALLAMLATEVLEDLVVLRELLPDAPIPQEVIWRDQTFDNSNPSQFLAVERRCRSSLGAGLTHSLTAPAIGASRVQPVAFDSVSPEMRDAPMSVVSLGPLEESRWRSVKSWLGQPRVLNPALPLHGLRELPFHIQLGSVGIMIEVTFGLLFVLLGPGFALGLVEDICTGSDQTIVESLFLWRIPLSC